MSSAHLARSYHHLFPVPNFAVVDLEKGYITIGIHTPSPLHSVYYHCLLLCFLSPSFSRRVCRLVFYKTTLLKLSTISHTHHTHTHTLYITHTHTHLTTTHTHYCTHTPHNHNHTYAHTHYTTTHTLISARTRTHAHYTTTHSLLHTRTHAHAHTHTHTRTTHAHRQSVQCFGCQKEVSSAETSSAYSCAKCANIFCYDCDAFIHDCLHNCPGCEVMGPIA